MGLKIPLFHYSFKSFIIVFVYGAFKIVGRIVEAVVVGTIKRRHIISRTVCERVQIMFIHLVRMRTMWSYFLCFLGVQWTFVCFLSVLGRSHAVVIVVSHSLR